MEDYPGKESLTAYTPLYLRGFPFSTLLPF